MRSHGWSGNAPRSDEEAVDRILDAADELVAAPGATLRLTDVARHLGVTRQTIYRYFRGADELLVASRMRSADGFIDRLAAHVRGHTEPVAALVESVSFAVETLSGDRQFEELLGSRDADSGFASLTSDTALAFGRSVLHRFDVDWAREGFDDDALTELAELALRTMHSLLIDPGRPPRDAASLRRFVARWLGPAIVHPRLARVLEPLQTGRPRPA